MAFAERAGRRVYQAEQLPDPGFILTLFGSPRMALLFLPLRVYIGWQWMAAGIEKVNSPAWTRNGTALQGFWVVSVKGTAGAKGAAIHYGWYHDFLQYMLNNQWYAWFAKLIAFGETAIGLSLIIGSFVGIAAFCGAFLNFNYLLAGTSSTNPVLFVLAIVLVLGWKITGYLGADYYLLPALGTPWQPGHVLDFARDRVQRTVSGKKSALGAAGFVGAFAVAAVLVVVASNEWSVSNPFVGYAVALILVLAAWLIGEAVLTATHGGDSGHLVPLEVKLGPLG